MCALPSPSTATLATEGQEGPVHVGKRSQSTGWLLTEVHATCNIPPVPAPAVASPTLLKHSFWSETPWSLTTDQFPLTLLPFHVEEGFYWAGEALMGSGHILGHLLQQSGLHQRSGHLPMGCLCKCPPMHGPSCSTQMPPWARCTSASHIPVLCLIMAAPAPVQSSHAK